MAIVFDPSSGNGNKAVSVSSSLNEGIDASATYKVATNNGAVSRNVVVNQLGKREVFSVKNGDNYESFLLSDGGTFNVLKAQYANG